MPDNTEINIPQPINRPKEDSKIKVEHPQSKVTADSKAFVGSQRVSRFEPTAVSVEVPSKGLLYRGKTNDEDAAKGIIKVKPITLNEEKILTTDRFIQSGKVLDLVLESCLKSDISPYDLLSSDRLYLLFYLRGMSYGLDYDFSVRCYHCGFNFEQTVSIDKLEVKTWDEATFQGEPFTAELPISKFLLKGHFMRGRDEAKLTEKARELKNVTQADDAIAEALYLLVDEVTTDKGEVLSPIDKEDFLNHMVGADADFFREVIKERDCGIQPLSKIYCPKCDAELDFNVPLGRNFFRGSRRGKE
jgi:hypothetical protein